MQVTHVAVRNLDCFENGLWHEDDVRGGHAAGVNDGGIVRRTFPELHRELHAEQFVGSNEERDLGLGRLQTVLLQVSAGTVGDELRDLGVEELLQQGGDFCGIGAGDRGFGKNEGAFGLVDIECETASGGTDFEAVHLEAGAG